VAEAVVGFPLDWVFECVVRLFYNGELRGGARVVVSVGMVLLDHVAERVTDLLFRGVLVDAE
jgi:hypothetical protein